MMTVEYEELLGLARQLAALLDNPTDPLKETLLDRYGGRASSYVESVANRLRPVNQYQELLGKIADAAGVSGSPTFDEVVQRVQAAREQAEKLEREADYFSVSQAATSILNKLRGVA